MRWRRGSEVEAAVECEDIWTIDNSRNLTLQSRGSDVGRSCLCFHGSVHATGSSLP
jgi:hypothetical protein